MGDHRKIDPADILLVEDNPGDVRLIREAFKAEKINARLHVVTDGEGAFDFLYRWGAYSEAPRPHLVVLDLNLPRIDGLEVLDEIKTDPDLKCIPVVILTSSSAEEDIVKSYESRANAYLTKPINPDEFVSLGRSFKNFWLKSVRLPPSPD